MAKIMYKASKNPNRPGPPGKGFIWMKDDNGAIVRNDQGEFGYRKATAAELAAKKKKSKVGKKKTRRGRKPAAATAALDASALLKKRTYGELSYDELQKVSEVVASIMEKRKESELKKIESDIKALEAKAKSLS